MTGHKLKGEAVRRRIPVCGPATFVVLKALAFANRGGRGRGLSPPRFPAAVSPGGARRTQRVGKLTSFLSLPASLFYLVLGRNTEGQGTTPAGAPGPARRQPS